MNKSAFALSLTLVSSAAMAQTAGAPPALGALGGLLSPVTQVLGGLLPAGAAAPAGTSAALAPIAGLVTPVTQLVSGLLPGVTGGAGAGALPGLGALPSLGALPGLGGLPGLPTGLIPLGVNVTQPGANGAGQVNTLNLGGATVVPNITNPLFTALTGNPSSPLQVGVIGGPGTANAPAGLLGLSALSAGNTGNGGAIGIGLINRGSTGNGQYLGIAALSQAGTSGTAPQGLGINLLNQGNPLSISVSGQTVLSLAGLQQQITQVSSTLPGLDVGGIAINSPHPTSSNPLLNVAILSGPGGAQGGLLGLGLLSGANTANNNQLAGVAVLSGDGSGNGAPINASVIGGNNSGNGSVIGAAVVGGNNTGNGGALGLGVITGSNSGNGGAIGAGVIGGNDSGNGGVLGAGVITADRSGNGGAIGAGVLNASGGQGGLLGLGLLNGNGDGANATPVAVRTLGNTGRECLETIRDASGRAVRREASLCKPLDPALTGSGQPAQGS